MQVIKWISPSTVKFVQGHGLTSFPPTNRDQWMKSYVKLNLEASGMRKSSLSAAQWMSLIRNGVGCGVSVCVCGVCNTFSHISSVYNSSRPSLLFVHFLSQKLNGSFVLARPFRQQEQWPIIGGSIARPSS